MKKIMLAIALLWGVSTFSYAQTPAKKATAQQQPSKKDTTRRPLKKDGTSDMRYKANKQAPPATHLKKDSTPDRRYKENKKKH